MLFWEPPKPANMFLYKEEPSTAPFEEDAVITASKTAFLKPSTASSLVKVSPVLGFDHEVGAFWIDSHKPVNSLTGLSLFVTALIIAEVGDILESPIKS